MWYSSWIALILAFATHVHSNNNNRLVKQIKFAQNDISSTLRKSILISTLVVLRALVNERIFGSKTVNAEDINPNRPLTILIVGGFLLDRKAYSSLASNVKENFPSANLLFESTKNERFHDQTIESRAFEIVSRLQSPNDLFVLIGHSLGGAVCLEVAIQLQSQKTVNNNIGGIIVIDPVDDDKRSTISHIEAFSKSLSFPCLMVSTPFGGKSSYYKKSFHSVCSPAERSCLSFYNSLRAKYGKNHINLVIFPDIGHLQIIDSSQSNINGVCAENASLSDDFKTAVFSLILFWINLSTFNKNNERFDNETTKVLIINRIRSVSSKRLVYEVI